MNIDNKVLSAKTFVLLVSVLALSSLSLAVSELTFNSNGVPTSLVLNGANRLDSDQSSSGFFLRKSSGRSALETKLKNVVVKGYTYTVSESGGLPRFTFRVDNHTRYVSFHMMKIEGITDRSTSLVLRINATVDLGSLWTGNGTQNRTINKGTKSFDHLVGFSNNDTQLTCTWSHLWRTDTDGKLGCFAIYDGYDTDEEVDDTLAEMWATEDKMVRPNVIPWDVDTVNKWVDEYAEKFGTGYNTLMLIEAANPKELYALTEVAIANKVKKIYLHCKTWRGEYWPKNNSLDHVNRNVFPKGLSDLTDYVDYLHDHGMIIYCHNVSLGVGTHDPDYIVGKVDRRLDAWGKGTLEADVDAGSTALLFRPDPTTALSDNTRPQSSNRQLKSDHMRIGDEIIKVGSYQETDQGLWRLTGCTRGIGATDAVKHSAGVTGAGLWMAYNMNFIPPYDIAKPDSLLEEMAQKYAVLVNRTKMDHIHFDGIGIHSVHPIGTQTVIDEVYRRVNRVVDSVRVGRSGTANFELAFRRVEPWTYVGVQIPLRLDETKKGQKWLASSRLDAHFSVADFICYGSRTVEVSHPWGGSGLTMDILNNHGLKDEMFGLLQNWRVILPAFTPADFKYLNSFLKRSGSHFQSADIPVMLKEGGVYKMQPYRIMDRSNGKDRITHFIQERGTIARRQYITTGETLSLVNPYDAQGAEFYIRLESDNTQNLVNPVITTGSGTVTVNGTVTPGDYLFYDGSSATAIIYDNTWNIKSQPSVTLNAYTMPSGTANVSVGPASPTLDLDVQFITKGSKYTLGANSNL